LIRETVSEILNELPGRAGGREGSKGPAAARAGDVAKASVASPLDKPPARLTIFFVSFFMMKFVQIEGKRSARYHEREA